MNTLLKSIVWHEGFSPVAYPDPLTKQEPYTFGHGLTYITESESLEIVKDRVTTLNFELSKKLYFFNDLPDTAKEVLIEMAYQMGVKGVLSFKNTLNYFSKHDWENASNNMKKSLWARQTPERANALAEKIKNLKDQK